MAWLLFFLILLVVFLPVRYDPAFSHKVSCEDRLCIIVRVSIAIGMFAALVLYLAGAA